VANPPKRRPWWRRLFTPKQPDLKLEELEAKLRKAERERNEKERSREGGREK
jgi:hypothetical protein